MTKFHFTSRAICSEFNITKISNYYNIIKKVKWEEPLILKEQNLGSLGNSQNKMVYIYYFGSIVFVNFTRKEIDEFIENIRSIPQSIKSINKDMRYDCLEEYDIVSDKSEEAEMGFEVYNTKDIENYHLDMTALVLAKSVALETIENRVSEVLDEVEKIIVSLRKGKVNLRGKKAAAIIGRVLSFKHTTISYIMLLDKPDITWKNQDAEIFFNDIADLFELDERYKVLNAKIQSLLDTIEIFADLSHTRTSTILEIIVILLILIEVIFAFEGPIRELFSK
ncbi:RMD1 family protein [Clostridium sp. 'White wine YQ']|uniref:RMD1 family protein n=1 Tax=Clostridium sp. 'White wine YQ' TaxID=3027474 RepID=UPI002365B46F|nr:RMD1 family protein [Clostridium sp. 'White wine YQ']MDD7794406.1 RMD1 family protein [Clostridium sp. 'White wine YQ']